MPNRYYGYYYHHYYYHFYYNYHHHYLYLSNGYSRTGVAVYRNEIYLTTSAEAKNFKYLVLDVNISPENMCMDMMVLKV